MYLGNINWATKVCCNNQVRVKKGLPNIKLGKTDNGSAK